MHSPVPLAIAKALSEVASERIAWVRFDFRGVGGSEGSYDAGRGETDDARAAIDAIRQQAPGVPLSLAGHSFGSWVGLRAAAMDGGDGTSAASPGRGRNLVERALLIAPSVRFFEFGQPAGEARFEGPVTIFVGDQDDLLDVAEAQELSARLGATLRVFEGYDHHFLKSRRAMAQAALGVLAPE
jgi:alpha/beta superfamily hydrolase